MSSNTTVVVAGFRFPSNLGGIELRFTAALVQNADILDDEMRGVERIEWAVANFLEPRGRQWFSGKGSLGRAKQLAHLIAEDARTMGCLEHNDRPIIEITRTRILPLTQNGLRHRQPPDPETLEELNNALAGFDLERYDKFIEGILTDPMFDQFRQEKKGE